MQSLPEIIYFNNTPALPLEIKWWAPTAYWQPTARAIKFITFINYLTINEILVIITPNLLQWTNQYIFIYLNREQYYCTTSSRYKILPNTWYISLSSLHIVLYVDRYKVVCITCLLQQFIILKNTYLENPMTIDGTRPTNKRHWIPVGLNLSHPHDASNHRIASLHNYLIS